MAKAIIECRWAGFPEPVPEYGHITTVLPCQGNLTDRTLRKLSGKTAAHLSHHWIPFQTCFPKKDRRFLRSAAFSSDKDFCKQTIEFL